MSSWNNNSPCAACKIQRRKCTQECIFAPYFPPDNPQKFAYVHKVFGASNVAKLLNEVNISQREDAVKSLAYEAEARLRDPVYGCVGLISHLQTKLRDLQNELVNAKKELASFHSPPQPPLLLPPAAATGSSYFSFGSSSAQQRHHEIFNFSGNNNNNINNSFSSFQMHPFQNQLMISSSSSSQPQTQIHNQFFSKKMLKEERQNLD
ncbi:LOB domain-containing protein 36-like [Trifolium pratense]|uniref:LOB domain-containing protein 36-like n=1 Tax=Trifolium pratense TaxID=57577 RepID=A0A2K3MUV2_TRIPR|nr:LOB domain-containing protein 36-like [Trifolium pratense]